VSSVRLGAGFETGLRLRLVSGYPNTPIVGSLYNANASQYEPITGSHFSGRNPPFFQLDFRVEKVWTFQKWLLSLYIDIQNITNRANTEFITWDYRFREAFNVQGMPFFLSLGLTGRF